MSRLDGIRTILGEHELDALVVSHPANRFYLSGFPADDHGPDESSGVVLVDGAAATLLVSKTNFPWARASARPEIAVEAVEYPWQPSLGTRLRESGSRRVGFEPNALTVGAHGRIVETAGDGVALVPVDGAVDARREFKDVDELATLQRAIALTDAVFAAALRTVRVGMTERALAWTIERLMREHGADGPAFETIVASGPHAARPHHTASERPLAAGEPVVVDMGARLDGYCADLTRTFCIGDPPERLRSIYTTVLQAQEAALAGLRAGLTGIEGDQLARGPIEAAGFGDEFVHGLGHGLGIKVHEAPSLGRKSEDTLRPGQVVTVEPGIYVEGWGGVRIEDVVVVEERGTRTMTAAPKRLADLSVPDA